MPLFFERGFSSGRLFNHLSEGSPAAAREFVRRARWCPACSPFIPDCVATSRDWKISYLDTSRCRSIGVSRLDIWRSICRAITIEARQQTVVSRPLAVSAADRSPCRGRPVTAPKGIIADSHCHLRVRLKVSPTNGTFHFHRDVVRRRKAGVNDDGYHHSVPVAATFYEGSGAEVGSRAGGASSTPAPRTSDSTGSCGGRRFARSPKGSTRTSACRDC